MADLCLSEMDGSILHVQECYEVLHKLYKPFLVTEEVEFCHHKPHATIGQGAKKWHFHMLTLVLHSNLRNVICHDIYMFPERRTSMPSHTHTHTHTHTHKHTTGTSNLSFALLHTYSLLYTHMTETFDLSFAQIPYYKYISKTCNLHLASHEQKLLASGNHELHIFTVYWVVCRLASDGSSYSGTLQKMLCCLIQVVAVVISLLTDYLH
jgi:hypothetical protein